MIHEKNDTKTAQPMKNQKNTFLVMKSVLHES